MATFFASAKERQKRLGSRGVRVCVQRAKASMGQFPLRKAAGDVADSAKVHRDKLFLMRRNE